MMSLDIFKERPGLENKKGDFFDLLSKIPVEALVADRDGQAVLHRLLSFHTTHDRESQAWAKARNIAMVRNPHPVVPVEAGGGTTFIHETFTLKGRKHYYYFHPGWPMENVPSYLRLDDVVGSGLSTHVYPDSLRQKIKEELGINDETLGLLIYDQHPAATRRAQVVEIPFNKPLNRVPVTGGEGERFNYVTNRWEPTGEVYEPSVHEKAFRSLGQVVQGLLEGVQTTVSSGNNRLLQNGKEHRVDSRKGG